MKSQTAKETEYVNAFSNQIKKLLEDNGLTQRQLAKAIGVSPNAVNEWVNEKSQPKWLLQMFGTIKFFYERVEGFNPMQLFYIEDFDLSKNGDEPLMIPIEKKMEQIKQDCNDKIERIKKQAQDEIKKIKDKYQGYKTDEFLEQISGLQKQIKDLQEQVDTLSIKPKTGRQNYDQYKEKLNKKYKDLKKEFDDYKETFYGLSLIDLSEEEINNLSKSMTVGNSIAEGKRHMKKLLNNPEFYKLIKKTFLECLTYCSSRNVQFTQEFYEELGEKLVDLIVPLTPYSPSFRIN